MGVERLVALLIDCGVTPPVALPHAYLVVSGDEAERQGVLLAESLRDRVPALRLQVNCGGGSFKSQIKRADKSGAAYALLLGEDEAARLEVGIKSLREDRPQQNVSQAELADYLVQLL